MSDTSEMMGLLQELALMKKLDERYASGEKTAAETAEFESRKNRRLEISDQIVALGGTVGSG